VTGAHICEQLAESRHMKVEEMGVKHMMLDRECDALDITLSLLSHSVSHRNI